MSTDTTTSTPSVVEVLKVVATSVLNSTAQLPLELLTRHNITGESHHSHIRSPEQVIAAEEQYIGRRLTQQESEMVRERVMYLKEHEGHESQHSRILLILIGSLVISQILITMWKRNHLRSYNMATLLGLWLVPIAMNIRNRSNDVFIVCWLIFSILNSIIVKRALESPMASSTPRLVYYWFQKVYDISYAAGIFGYVIAMVAIFHIPMLFNYTIEQESYIFGFGITTLFYALYFGTLGRDFVDRLSDRMATTMGYYSKSGFPRKHLRESMCAICGTTTQGSSEKLHKLNCAHTYHEICIKGWTIIGKKDVCPYCKEKVDLNDFKKNSWDTSQKFYLNLLDFMRYILVWNPVTFLLVHYVVKFSGLK